MIINLTQHLIDRELCSDIHQGRIEFVDEGRSGLYVECRTAIPNEGTYYLRLKDRNTGKTRHHRIGKTKDLSLAEALRQALNLREQILIGSGALANRERAVLTYDSFMANYYFPSKQSKRSLDKDRQLHRTRLKDVFGDTPLSSITRQQVHAFQMQLGSTKLSISTQNAYLRLLRHSLNIALDLELIARNPATRLKLRREDNIVENYLNEEQVARLITILDAHENLVVAGLIRLLLATGARRGEALKARWSDIKFDQRLWIIPSENSKSRKVGSIPLSDAALKVINRMPRHEHTDYIFVNPSTRTRYTDIKKSWSDIKRRANLPEVTRLHDLRHTFASLLINHGRSLYEVQRILRHSDPKVTQRYSHLNSSTLRDAIEVASHVKNPTLETQGAQGTKGPNGLPIPSRPQH